MKITTHFFLALVGLTAAAPTTSNSSPNRVHGFRRHASLPPISSSLSTFKSSPVYSHLALAAPVPCPYTPAFTNSNATAIHRPIAHHVLSLYNAAECAAHCTTHGACKSFGVYIERRLACDGCAECVEEVVCALYNVGLEKGVVSERLGWDVVKGKGGKGMGRGVRASNGYNRVRAETQTVVRTVSVGVETVTERVTVTQREGAVTVTQRPDTVTVTERLGTTASKQLDTTASSDVLSVGHYTLSPADPNTQLLASNYASAWDPEYWNPVSKIYTPPTRTHSKNHYTKPSHNYNSNSNSDYNYYPTPTTPSTAAAERTITHFSVQTVTATETVKTTAIAWATPVRGGSSSESGTDSASESDFEGLVEPEEGFWV